MRRFTIVVASALAAAAFTAAPASAAEEVPRCDFIPCPLDIVRDKVDDLAGPTADKVVWAVTCAGYALGGNPCTGQ